MKALFSKTFEHSEIGQIVAFKQDNDDSFPEIRFYTQPPGMDVCSIAIAFKNEKDGLEKRDKLFEELTLKDAEGFALHLVKQSKELT